MISRHLAGAGLACFIAASSAHAATVNGGTLLSGAGAAQIENWIESTPGLSYSGSLTFTNVFDSSGGADASAFHLAADSIGPTIAIMEARQQGTADPFQIIGGFNPQSWDSSNSWHLTPTTADRTAFIFNLTAGQILRQQTAGNFAQYQTYNSGIFGPVFGGGYDIGVYTDLHSGYVYAHTYCLDPTVSCIGGPNVLGQSGAIDVEYGMLEIYSVSQSPLATPLPPALTLFASGLAGFGWLARRRKKQAN